MKKQKKIRSKVRDLEPKKDAKGGRKHHHHHHHQQQQSQTTVANGDMLMRHDAITLRRAP